MVCSGFRSLSPAGLLVDNVEIGPDRILITARCRSGGSPTGAGDEVGLALERRPALSPSARLRKAGAPPSVSAKLLIAQRVLRENVAQELDLISRHEAPPRRPAGTPRIQMA